jgi:hypothetical protein
MDEKKDVAQGAFATTVAYVSQFYPLWFTYNQSRFATHNRLVGPDKVTPLYHIVVAINVDTLYVSTFLELADGPVVLTIPSTEATYSMLNLNAYGDIFQTTISKGTPGVYGFTGPGFTGTLPDGIIAVPVPYNFSTLIFRVDKFSADGQDQMVEAEKFRSSLQLQPLSDYVNDPSGGATAIVTEKVFAIPYKTIADNLATQAPLTFLKELQTAVASSNTPALTPEAQALSDRFDSLFGASGANLSEFAAGCRAAHELILDRYLTHTDAGKNYWIHFTNIGQWGDHVVERSGITEFIQYGNGPSTAAYYHTFKDTNGAALDGNNSGGYVLQFAPDQIPQAERFWSLTAYTPNSIELIENPADKWHIGSYEPGLKKDSDGSISIYIGQNLPAGVPRSNWLPVAADRFNIMLRIYGPVGNEGDTYIPPGIQSL